jgi:hypothetical protein
VPDGGDASSTGPTSEADRDQVSILFIRFGCNYIMHKNEFGHINVCNNLALKYLKIQSIILV